MLLERLDVQNVRNIASAELTLDTGVNLLIGPNGAGKTAVLEAVHLLFCGRSFRTNRSESLVRRGEAHMSVAASCRDEGLGAVRLGHLRDRGRVELRRDGQLVRQASALAALLPIQLLLPDLGELVFGGPAGRRQWLDWGAFHGQPDHAGTLRAYLRALRHRNALLRRGELATLAPWSEQVAALGERVAAARCRYFEEAAPAVHRCLGVLNENVALTVRYDAGWEGGKLASALAASLERDVRTGATNAGPHRADLHLLSDGEPAAAVLSRGQGKVVASALRLGQAQNLMATSKPSLFLIDDVGAELDVDHSERFFGVLGEMACQILATSARLDSTHALRALPTRMFHVEHGVVRKAG